MILFAGYRDWALEAFRHIDPSITIVKSEEELQDAFFTTKGIEAVVFVGWSWMVPDEIVNSVECVCYHPSDLPKYKGGSPIQHQVLDGVLDTYATLFLMTSKVDDGPVFSKQKISLRGGLKAIFDSLSFSAAILVSKYLDQVNAGLPRQFHQQETTGGFFRKRRKPEESEITIDDLLTENGESLVRKIQVLSDPYPNAFIRTIDGGQLLLKKVIFKK